MGVHNFCIDSEDRPDAIPWFDMRDLEVDEAVQEARDDIEMWGDGIDLNAADADADEMRQIEYDMHNYFLNALVPE